MDSLCIKFSLNKSIKLLGDLESEVCGRSKKQRKALWEDLDVGNVLLKKYGAASNLAISPQATVYGKHQAVVPLKLTFPVHFQGRNIPQDLVVIGFKMAVYRFETDKIILGNVNLYSCFKPVKFCIDVLILKRICYILWYVSYQNQNFKDKVLSL